MTTIRVALLRNGTLRQGGVELIDEWKIATPTTSSGWTSSIRSRKSSSRCSRSASGSTSWPRKTRSPPPRCRNTTPSRTTTSSSSAPSTSNVSQHASETYKIAAFLGRNFLFTVHRGAVRAIDDVCNRLPGDRRILERGPDFLLYSIVDQMVDAHFPLLETDRRSSRRPAGPHLRKRRALAPRRAPAPQARRQRPPPPLPAPARAAQPDLARRRQLHPVASTSSTSATSTTTCSASARPSTSTATR